MTDKPSDRAAEFYAWIRDNTSLSFSISRDDHKSMHQTAAQTFEWCDGYHSENCTAKERQRMIDTNTIWTIHLYPNNAVGFYVVHASTLDVAMRDMMEAVKGKLP